MSLIESTDRGLFCAQAGVYIDPWRPVDKALITHGHSDHSRWGHKVYGCVHSARPILRHRLGKVNIRSFNYGDPFTVNGVTFSFHPAGHIIGSAQIRVEHQGEIWVVSGDYKLDDDGISEPYEQLQCHSFITESTFGLPVYNWPEQSTVYREINEWWAANAANGQTSMLTAYSLGKAQRVMHHLDTNIGPLFCHGAIANMNDALVQAGVTLPAYQRVLLKNTQKAEKTNPEDFAGGLVIAPPSATGSTWMKRFKSVSVGVASGWMALRGTRRRRGADRGFVLSDHADWKGLNQAIRDSGAENVYPTHGYTSIFSQWLESEGYNAAPIETAFVGEQLETAGENAEEMVGDVST